MKIDVKDIKNIENTIDMRSFEMMAETSTPVEFKSLILNLEGKKIDEIGERVEKFDRNNTGNFYEDTVENYLRELSSIKSLKKEEISELIRNIQGGDTSSREILMEGSLKLVAKTALYYSKVGTSYVELVQDGILGVVEAIDSYDLDCPMDFLEYMGFWIKYEMIQSNKLIVEELKSPIVAYFKNMKVEVYKSENKIINSETDEAEIKRVLNMDLEEFENLQKINDYGFLIKEEDREEAEVYKSIAEIDMKLAKVEKLMSVSNLANKFTSTEIKILDLYYGLSGKRKYFEEIGEILDMQPSKVKSEIEKLMIKLKYNGKKEWIDED